MGALLQTLRSLGPLRLAVMGGVVFGLIAFFLFLSTRLGGPPMALLYSDLQQDDSGRIVQQLESQGIPFEIRQNGSQIMVPGDQALRLRLQMAQQGLPSGGSVGYEIFDKADKLGTTNFVQNVNLVRALEGELARTIRALSTVKSARVHLVMPRRELFSREKQEPSASIILTMRGSRLSTEQVLAVQHLVAAAVPGLEPTRISIVDDKGSLLARGFEDGKDVGLAAARADERRRNYEDRLKRTVEELVERTVGYGKVRAEVTADIDFDRISTNQESFDPEGQVARSTQTVEQNSTSREAERQAVTVATNLPDQQGGADGASANSAETRTEETVNYEISKRVVNHVREAGLVRRLSVAVLVDGITPPGPNSQYQPRAQQEMELIATLVRTAVGFNADRGDSVEVVNMPFATAADLESPLDLFFGFTKNDILRLAEILVLSIVAVLVILLVVRPLVARAFEALPLLTAAAETRLLAEQAAPALAPPVAPGEVAPPEDMFDELIDIDRVEGRVRASSVKKVGEIVEKHPEEALSIIRSWMYQEA